LHVVGDFTLQSNIICTDCIDSADILDGTIKGVDIAVGAIGGVEIGANAVGAGEIRTDAVRADEIQAGAVGTSEIAADAVTSTKIATDAVGHNAIVATAVRTAEIADGQVMTDDLADNAVTGAKIAGTGKLIFGSCTGGHGSIGSNSGITTIFCNVPGVSITDDVIAIKTAGHGCLVASNAGIFAIDEIFLLVINNCNLTISPGSVTITFIVFDS